MSQINITFPDGSVRSYEQGVSGHDIAMSISPRLAADVLAVSVKPEGDNDPASKGTVIDVTRPIMENCQVRLLKWEDDEAKRVFWHSSSHLMAEALEALYPGVKFGIGPAVENGFYYDVDFGGMTFTQVLGCGREKGTREYEVDERYEMELLPKQQINVVVDDSRLDEILDLIKKELYTGHIGDGKIFVYHIDNAIRVRTGDEGVEAL